MITARREILCAIVYAVSCLQAVAADPPRPRFRTVHRQVSRLPLTRDVVAQFCKILEVLVVAQTADVHDEIEGLLRGLHERGLAELGGPHDPPAAKAPTVRVYHVADEAARRDQAAKLVEL